jgi:hypothetical protein
MQRDVALVVLADVQVLDRLVQTDAKTAEENLTMDTCGRAKSEGEGAAREGGERVGDRVGGGRDEGGRGRAGRDRSGIE